MSFQVHPQPDACRALMPTPEPHPPGPPSRPMACHMPKGHDGPHALTRRPGPLDRRWEGDARPDRPAPSPAAAGLPAEDVERVARPWPDAVLVEGDWVSPSREAYARDLLKAWADAASNAGCPPHFVERMRTHVEVHERARAAAEAAPESYQLQPVTLRLMDALGITPYIERLAAWLSHHLPQSRSTR